VIRRLILIALGAAALHSLAAQSLGAHLLEFVGRHSPEMPADTAVVERVLDGDTVILKDSHDRVRLANIDAPEMGHGYGRPSQPCAVQATKWMKKKVEGQRVTLRCPDQDRYGRRVCVLFLDGEDVNKGLVRVGLAWANTARPQYLRDTTVLDVQHEAQASRAGLWAQARPTPPWIWRWECWERASCGNLAH
jgi:endonuclease YncB( thermonuclease family)